MTSEETGAKPAPHRSRVLEFFAGHPLIGLIGVLGSLASIIGLVIVLLDAPPRPLLTVFEHPDRTTVARSNEPGMTVTYRGEPLDADVTTVQVAFWNAGDRPIYAREVLTPLTLRLSSRLLDARLLKSARDVCGIQLSTGADGSVVVNWRVLETGDGGVVQLTYVGDDRVQLTAQGTIVGQRDVHVGRADTEDVPTRMGAFLKQKEKRTTELILMLVTMVALLASGMTSLRPLSPLVIAPRPPENDSPLSLPPLEKSENVVFLPERLVVHVLPRIRRSLLILLFLVALTWLIIQVVILSGEPPSPPFF